MKVLYSNNTREVGICSQMAPLCLGTVAMGAKNGACIGTSCAEIRSTSFLSFHITQQRRRSSCILDNVVPWGTFLKAHAFFNSDGSLNLFDLLVPATYVLHANKSKNRPMLLKRLSITTICPMFHKLFNNLNTTLCTKWASP